MAFTAFDENRGFRDFRVSVIIYCPV